MEEQVLERFKSPATYFDKISSVALKPVNPNNLPVNHPGLY